MADTLSWKAHWSSLLHSRAHYSRPCRLRAARGLCRLRRHRSRVAGCLASGSLGSCIPLRSSAASVLTHDADRAGLSLACASSAYLRLLESDPPGRWRSDGRCVGLNYTRTNGNGKKNLHANEWMLWAGAGVARMMSVVGRRCSGEKQTPDLLLTDRIVAAPQCARTEASFILLSSAMMSVISKWSTYLVQLLGWRSYCIACFSTILPQRTLLDLGPISKTRGKPCGGETCCVIEGLRYCFRWSVFCLLMKVPVLKQIRGKYWGR